MGPRPRERHGPRLGRHPRVPEPRRAALCRRNPHVGMLHELQRRRAGPVSRPGRCRRARNPGNRNPEEPDREGGFMNGPAGEARDRRLETLHTIEDLRVAAERRLPRAIFDTIDGAAGDEAAAKRNVQDLSNLSLVPRVLVDVSSVETSTSVLGQPIDFPILLAPTGFNGLYYPDGELSVSAAAK